VGKAGYKEAQREAERATQMAYVVRTQKIPAGKGVKLPSGAVYRRKGASLVRTNKPEAGMTKKQRRRARAAAKAAAPQTVDQIQADLAAEGNS
jgi:hypothetical protein